MRAPDPRKAASDRLLAVVLCAILLAVVATPIAIVLLLASLA